MTLQPTPAIGATATQNTSISSSGIEGSCFAQSHYTGPMNGNKAQGESDLIVRFTITETVTYTMQGTFVSSGLNALLASPMIHLTMNDFNGPTVELVQAMSGTTPFLRTGQLQPGVYALRAYVFSGSIGGDFNAHSVDLDFNFTVTPSAGVLPVFVMAVIAPRRRRREQVGRVSRRVG